MHLMNAVGSVSRSEEGIMAARGVYAEGTAT